MRADSYSNRLVSDPLFVECMGSELFPSLYIVTRYSEQKIESSERRIRKLEEEVRELRLQLQQDPVKKLGEFKRGQ